MWEVLEKKFEFFNISLVEFQGVISCVAAFWMKRNTALRTYKSSFTFDIFPHAHSSTAPCCCFVTDLLNQHHACMCCNQQHINVFLCFP
jgi:ABC-type nickel/cobalt efflux system permease component RcnA